MTEEELINEILEIIKDRILIAEKRKEEYALDIELASFWDGELRCAQDLLNKISKASKGKKDEPMTLTDMPRPWSTDEMRKHDNT